MNWTPLHLHSHYSLLDGASKPDQIRDRCLELGYTSCAITDHGSISGAVSISKTLSKKGIKPILGCELYVCDNAKLKDKTVPNEHFLVLAKNKNGWHNLIKIVSESSKEENFYRKPRVDFSIVREYAKDLIGFSGHAGSTLANVLFKSKEVYNAKTYNDAAMLVCPDAKAKAIRLAEEMNDIFGDFFIEIQTINQTPYAQVIADILREVSKITKIKSIATADSHYTTREQAIIQRILLCCNVKTTFKQVEDKLLNEEDFGLSGFFKTDSFHIPSLEEIKAVNTEEEIENTQLVDSLCEEYSLANQPRLPKFCENEYEKLVSECRTGWIKHKFGNNNTYLERLQEEFSVIKQANLSGYFLIVQDYVKWVQSQNCLTSSRGSVGGSLIAYLIGLSHADPIKYDLFFERFYNIGRNTGEHVSLPDIDIDFPIHMRPKVIEYLKGKYGKDRVSGIATFGRAQGKGALKDVLRVYNACSQAVMNEITKFVPDESEIGDKMEQDKEDSVIRWTLMNEPQLVQDYCRLEDNGELVGDYANYFNLAIQLEGTLKSQGRHACGIVIGNEAIGSNCPIFTDGDDIVAAFEKTDLEYIGMPKFDLLGVAALDKLEGFNNLLKFGRIKC